jgi:hypothetical protein
MQEVDTLSDDSWAVLPMAFAVIAQAWSISPCVAKISASRSWLNTDGRCRAG